MIFRRYTDVHITKMHLRLFSLHKVFKPWTEAIVRGGTIKTFLCPRRRNNECSFFNANGEDLEEWLKDNAKGSYIFDVYPTKSYSFLKEDPCIIRVRFTDPNSALMFKLQMGGR